jgi:hypothetical protein
MLKDFTLKEKVIPQSMFFLLLQFYMKTNQGITETIPNFTSKHIEKTKDDGKDYCVFSVYQDEAFRIRKDVVKEILDAVYTGGMGETRNPPAPDLNWDANKWFDEQTGTIEPVPAPSLADTWFASIASSLAPPPPH